MARTLTSTILQPNAYHLEGDVAFLQVAKVEVTVDAEDLARILSFARWTFDGAYAVVNRQVDLEITKTYLHRFLMKSPEGLLVDHIDRNTLDCRKSNLRLVTKRQNQQNIKTERDGTASGHRNVYRVSGSHKWEVKVLSSGSYTRGGCFERLEDAIEAARSLRAAVHSHSPENSLAAKAFVEARQARKAAESHP